jgi:site-specific recombinase XerD
VEPEDIHKLKKVMRSKKTPKKVIERNILIIILIAKAGLQQSELNIIKVKNIDLERHYSLFFQDYNNKDRMIVS